MRGGLWRIVVLTIVSRSRYPQHHSPSTLYSPTLYSQSPLAMDTQRFDMSIKKPIPMAVKFPLLLVEDEEIESSDFVSRYPSPPPPTPCIPRRRTPMDAQRYDPYKTMLAATSPPRYSSPDPEDPLSQSVLPESVAFPLPLPSARDVYSELLEFRFGEPDSGSSEELTSDSEDTATPTDEIDVHGFATTYCFTGTSEEGDFPIERTIVRPAPTPRFRVDLTRALASLAARSGSTTTLRTVPSVSQLSGASTPSSPEDDYDGAIAPPASTVASRRPSLAPLALGEVTKSLKRFASRLDPTTPAYEKRVDSGHLEEAVDQCEDAWARAGRGEPLVEVFVARTRGTSVEDRVIPGFDYEGRYAVNFGVGDVGRRGVGNYGF
ncbi:uncharacterized protein TRAVEDRAFT_51742 [Trametes versicolor FP-101664 SS1]|uniref:uncharacterized protein n=1 Tax=Trametes versicolor (strain FP-101664) TaxID=717944 RepID=UPI00046218CB|nr:uncharacterized protein TRAVEDRAFT_51742 [Trametes versicolor FP-101664 SS1]EIW54009.1 hypothetical protein TRAVEDRAFT_51742 [Trametes versicolor FP-101664 SS1]